MPSLFDLTLVQDPPTRGRTTPFSPGLLDQPSWEQPEGEFQTPETFGLFSTKKEIAVVQ